MPNHVHPPRVKFLGVSFGCGFFGHDPGCGGLPPEARCIEILMGRRKGNFLCLHPQQLADAVDELEEEGKKQKTGKQKPGVESRGAKGQRARVEASDVDFLV